MSEENNELIVPKHLADLMPSFMANRRKELDELEQAFAKGHLDKLLKLATKIEGFGGSQGFPPIKEFGTELREAAIRADYDALAAYILLYRQYLDRVRLRVEE